MHIKMTTKNILDDSDGRNSQQCNGLNGDNSYSENEDVNTESDSKSAQSQTDYYSNTTNSDVVIQRIDNAIVEKMIIDYDDSEIMKSASCRRTCCKS